MASKDRESRGRTKSRVSKEGIEQQTNFPPLDHSTPHQHPIIALLHNASCDPPLDEALPPIPCPSQKRPFIHPQGLGLTCRPSRAAKSITPSLSSSLLLLILDDHHAHVASCGLVSPYCRDSDAYPSTYPFTSTQTCPTYGQPRHLRSGEEVRSYAILDSSTLTVSRVNCHTTALYPLEQV